MRTRLAAVLLLSILRLQRTCAFPPLGSSNNNIKRSFLVVCHRSTLRVVDDSSLSNPQDEVEDADAEETDDTIRVRIWRALASGEELSLAKLSTIVGERRSDVRHHLGHVEKQAKTISSKSAAWLIRRGLSPDNNSNNNINNNNFQKLRIQQRRGGGKRNEIFVRLR